MLSVINDKPEHSVSPGITPQKQVHLFLKWRKMVPDEYKDITCPQPTPESVAQLKESNKERQCY